MNDPENILTDLEIIARLADERTAEHEAFRAFLKEKDDDATDEMVFRLNEFVSAKIDCTACGNCCRSFMINVSEDEAADLSHHLQLSTAAFKEKYVESADSGRMIMNTIPCAFLEENKCTVYEHRFSGCREFPHLDRPNFAGRLFGILMYYGTCPIIFNVVELLKDESGFRKQG